MIDMEKILTLTDVTAGYDGHIILQDVSLNIYEKDFLGIIGPNGGGKTTLLKVILGLIKPFQGRIQYFGPLRDSKQRNIGYLPQIKSFDRAFPITVGDVVLSGSYAGRKSQQPGPLMQQLGIMHLKHKAIGELSGGQVQRAFLCRALISSPELLILDEPNAFVDQAFEQEFMNILKDLNKDIAIVLVSHDTGIISSHVKNIACVNRILHYHDSHEFSGEMIDALYTCPVEIITHGRVPHRVLHDHNKKKGK